MRRAFIYLGVLLLVALSLLGVYARETGTRPALAAHPAAGTDRPAGPPEPALAIVQYVLDHPPLNTTCSGPYGTPGHRTLTCLAAPGHDTNGSVDEYDSPGTAQSAWLTRRTQAQQTFPYFGDQFWGGYPGYWGYNDAYPYAFRDDVFWGELWVIGDHRHDDTHFRYAPNLVDPLYNAAVTLGYLGNPSPTPITSATATQPPNNTATATPPATVTATATGTASTTASPTTTAVGTPEPALEIVNYVLSHPPAGVTCQSGGGTPGDRSLSCIAGAGHATTGRVVQYASPEAAQAAWMAGRDQARQTYPYFGNQFWGGYPGYWGYNENYPYGRREDALWGNLWVIGDIRYDDTSFRYAPDLTTPLYNAAVTLGYLGNPTATPTGSVTPTVTPCSWQFSDVHPTDYFYMPVQNLVCRGVVNGYSDGTFRPYNPTTRAQLVKMVVLAFGLTAGTATPVGGQTFADVPPSHPFYSVIEIAAGRTLVGGYDCGGPGEPCDPANRPYFRPYTDVTRGQLTKITATAAGWPLRNPLVGTFEDVPPGSAFYPFVETAVCRGIISGYDCGGPGEPCGGGGRPYFRGGNAAVRGQTAKIISGALTAPSTCAP
ncbi:MAG TPA: S-layer homology domain-containing protein [Chloroflexia bacterium]|nr:S-layer homology domain-containing protein [Chloroflexia bacterium]